MVSRSRAKERAIVSTKAVPGKDGISSTEIVATAANTATEGVKHFEDFAQVSSIQSQLSAASLVPSTPPFGPVKLKLFYVTSDEGPVDLLPAWRTWQ